MVQLADHPDITIAELRRRTGLTHSATVRMVAQLELRGLVMRGRTDADRRAVVLTLTAAGRDRAASVLATRAEALARMLAPLSSDDREQLERILELLLSPLPTSADQATVICRLCELPACPQDQCPVVHGYLRHLES